MKVITCFSYKGGAGRTTASANIAAALASVSRNVGSIESPLNRKVALIDLDVFSAGTHRVFEISNEQIRSFEPCVQDYLREQMAPADYIDRGGIKLDHSFMGSFRMNRGGANNCHHGFTLFPAKPDPDARFVVQKQHENVLIELLMELEGSERGFDYVILDGESGTRQMADIAVRLSDVVLMFFRLTWQHIEGTLNTALDFDAKTRFKKPFYLIPTCVPLVSSEDNVYRERAPGLAELADLTERIPEASTLNEYARQHRDGAGHFWDGPDRVGGARLCVHDSLFLKGEERVIVFDADAHRDRAADDFYRIAAELDRLLDPSK
ncbi:MAG TPA: AAA family ATPase [Pyrinomonadaceae bacterium]|jgi:MinD-like ATPase involved in chromosome partitioning or flagellar assembly|nr:AAA family ATPase [Pyrinomonadaceae bacterium]